jgi:hypothetical protein
MILTNWFFHLLSLLYQYLQPWILLIRQARQLQLQREEELEMKEYALGIPSSVGAEDTFDTSEEEFSQSESDSEDE